MQSVSEDGAECGAEPFGRLEQAELGSSLLCSEVPGGVQEDTSGNLSVV